jgi:cation transport ATPase
VKRHGREEILHKIEKGRVCLMAEKEKKDYGETDSIKAMLERLRRSVTDLPPEVDEQPKQEEKTEEKARPAKKTITKNAAVAAVTVNEEPAFEKTNDMQETVTEEEEATVAPVVQEASAPVEPLVNVEQQPSPEEVPAAVEDENLVLVPWEEDDPLETEAGDLPDDDLPWYNDENEEILTIEGTTSETVENEIDEADEEDEAPFFAAEVDDAIVASFFEAREPEDSGETAQASETAVSDTADNLPVDFVDVVDEEEEETVTWQSAPVITDAEVARLFQTNEPMPEPPVAPPPSQMEETRTVVEANEDNGYAVEVEVKRSAQPVMAGYEEAAPAAPEEEAPADAEESAVVADASIAEEAVDEMPANVKTAATQGLSNGETVWRDDRSRRRPVEVLEAEDTDEQPPVADFREFLGKGKAAEKYEPENDSVAPLKYWEKQDKKKPERFGPGVQITIDDIKKENAASEPKKGFLSKMKEKMTKKRAADAQEAPQPGTKTEDQTSRDRYADSKTRVREGESSAARALAGLYQEEAAAYNEYTSRSQISVFRRKFESELSFLALRMGILSFLSVLLLVLENGLHWGMPLERLFASPVSMAGLHVILLFFSLLCCIPIFAHAWRQLFARRVVSELFVVIGLLCALLYGSILCFALIPADVASAPALTNVRLFGLLPVLAALVATITEFYKVKNDLSSFELISSAGDKLACSVQNGSSTRSEAAAVSDLREGEETRIVSIKKIGFTSGFFHRITRNCEDEQKNLWLLPTAGVAALMVAIITGVMAGDVLSACYAFCVTVVLSLPLCALVLHDLPISTLFRFAASHSCAVAGEVSAIEYSDTDAFAFEDVEAFSARGVRVQRIKLYNDSALDHVLYQVAGVFSAVGGPLDGVFRNSTAELGLPQDIRLQQVHDGGLVVVVDGRRIYVGNGDFMLKKNVRMYYDAEDEQILANGKTSILYAAEDGQLSAKFYIRYRINEEFEREVERLAANHIRVLIRTFDPNIRYALIDKISYIGKYDLRVVRKTVEQQQDYAAPQINSGIVTRRSVREILRVLLACRRACRLTSFSEAGGLVIGCIGMLVSIVIAALGMMLSLPSWMLAIYQLLWILPVFLASKLYIARK